MKSRQTGFTLIELVMVIVILGILAAIALPKFLDLGSDARTAAAQGVAGALSSAAAINYSARSANSTRGFAVANCQDVAKAMSAYTDATGAAAYTTGLPTGYTITSAAVAAGVTKTDCVLVPPTSSPVTPNQSFTAIGIS